MKHKASGVHVGVSGPNNGHSMMVPAMTGGLREEWGGMTAVSTFNSDHLHLLPVSRSKQGHLHVCVCVCRHNRGELRSVPHCMSGQTMDGIPTNGPYVPPHLPQQLHPPRLDP
jgi:hypothetical protein